MSLSMPREQPARDPLENLSTSQLTERAKSLLASMQQLLTDLTNSVNAETTTRLRDQTAQFATVIEQIDTNVQRTTDITEQILAWKSQHRDRIQQYQPVVDAIARLEQGLPHGHRVLNSIQDVLTLCESAIHAHERYKSNKAELAKALAKDDVEIDDPLTEDLLKQSQQLKQRLDKATLSINQALDTVSPKEPKRAHKQPGHQEETTTNRDTAASPKKAAASDSPSVDNENPLSSAPPTAQHDTTKAKSDAGQSSDMRETQSDSNTDESPALPNDSVPTIQHADTTAAEIKQPPTVNEIENAISTALGQHRFAIAFHLASLQPAALPTPNVVKMVATNFVDHTDPQMLADLPTLATELKAEASTVLNSNAPAESKENYVVLLVSSCLWASTVIAPGGPIAQLIKYLVPYLNRFPEFRDLALTVAEISLKGFPVIPGDSLGQESWQQRRDKLEKEIMSWITTEQTSTLRFPPATQLWRYLLKDWTPKNDHPASASLKFTLTSLMKASTPEELRALQPLLEHWKKNVDKEIDRLDGVLRHKRVTRDRITGPVRTRLKRKIQNAVALADKWISIATQRPNLQTDPHIKLHDQLAATIDAVRPALEVHDAFQASHIYTPVLTRQMVVRYLNIFKQSSDEYVFDSGVSLDALLSGDLFASHHVAYDHEANTPIPTESELLQLAHLTEPDYGAAIIHWAKAGRFDIAEEAITYGEQRRIGGSTLLAEVDATHIRTNVSKCFTEMKDQLEKELRQIRLEIDTTYALGALTAQQSEQLRESAQLEISPSSRPVNFIHLNDKLQTLKNELSGAKHSLRASMYRRLRLLKAVPNSDLTRAVTAIEEERFLLADEFLDWMAKGYRLPDSSDRIRLQLDEFYPTFVEDYGRYRIDHPESIEIVKTTFQSRSSLNIGNTDIDARELTVDLIQRATALLDAWDELAQPSQSKVALVRNMMLSLGFTDRTVVRKNGDNIFTMECEPITKRDLVPLPDFGSRANGRYRILVIYERDSANAIVDSIRHYVDDSLSPIIVIFLNVLDVAERRSLVDLLHANAHRPSVVLDESLLVFLATRSGDVRKSFFACAAPFSVTCPYDPDTPAVPKEMFFGRNDERNAILSTSGDYTHLVYGGRRMGKTALFADIATEFRRDPAMIVQHLNLQGLGLSDAPDHLWHHVAEELRQSHEGVVGPRARQFEGVSSGIRKWLEQDDTRRILLLLDEADDFLEADRLNQYGRYRVLSQVKKLMDDTDRRFKVVFAGLHNVQRTARDSNTPFAQLGTPVRIGPMLPNWEADDSESRFGKEIQDLIQLPFEAMGYRFESRDSIIRIAAETNYYPALAQHFCKELLVYLQRSSMATSSGPPWSISPQVVDRVFHSRDTRNRIRNFFLWTIELDSRYNFLTYLIASNSFDDDDHSVSLQTLSVEEIRTKALRHEPLCFTDKSYLTFEVLLEEMVGLGILRESDPETLDGEIRFGIRSRNLRRLLGDSDEVIGKLYDAALKQSDPRYHWAEFREVIGGLRAARHGARARAQWARDEMLSPFTAAQERSLESLHKGVVVVFGTKMAGLDRIAEAVKDLAVRIESRGSARVECEVCSVASAVSKISKIARSKARAALQYHFVIVTGSVYSDRVNRVMEILAASRSKSRIIRPVFVCDPAAAWRWLGGGRVSRLPTVDLHEVWLGRCARDFVRRLLNERPGKKCKDLETDSGDAGSLWPSVVESVAFNSDLVTVEDAIASLISSGSIVVRDALEVGESEPALRTLCDFEGEMSAYDIAELLSGDDGLDVPEHDVSRVLHWAEKLSIVDDLPGGYRLDSAWAGGLKSVSGGAR